MCTDEKLLREVNNLRTSLVEYRGIKIFVHERTFGNCKYVKYAIPSGPGLAGWKTDNYPSKNSALRSAKEYLDWQLEGIMSDEQIKYNQGVSDEIINSIFQYEFTLE